MRYQRSLEIEKRLENVLRLIQTGNYSTPDLAERLGVSIPTISRTIEALRERGHNIRSEKGPNGWHYTVFKIRDLTNNDRLEISRQSVT